MTNEEWASPGARLRYARKKIIKLTQDKLAEKLGVTRSLIPTMEADRQGISRQTVEKLYADFGINPTWLISGDGEPLAAYSQEPMTNQNVILNDKNLAYKVTGGAAQLFVDPRCFRDFDGDGRFGYIQLAGIKLRLHAAKDSLLEGTQLYRFIEDENLWRAAGELNGWEFEVLREYYASAKDRSVAEWMELLRFVRWVRRTLAASAGAASAEREAQSA